ncbi:hypothetical protein ACW9HQ_39480 [Nocardia gipuzkoensis]
MNGKDPIKDPFRWFFNASLLVLFGVVALTISIDLLSQIWLWVIGIGVLIGGAAIGVAIWQERRRPW